MKTPHKHAELIKAWADGVEIEYQVENNPAWYPLHKGWSWDNALVVEYRIKPRPDTEYRLRTYEHSGGSMYTPRMFLPTEFTPANLKLIFDGETGKLKSAEVL